MPTPASRSTQENTKFTTILVVLKISYSLPGQPKPQIMPDVLGEHQFTNMLENFDTIYISTNQTVPFISQSFIAGSAILYQMTGHYRVHL